MSRKNPVPLVTISLDDDEEEGGEGGDLAQVDSREYQKYVYAASEAPLGMYHQPIIHINMYITHENICMKSFKLNNIHFI
jgi:hypothetical protein